MTRVRQGLLAAGCLIAGIVIWFGLPIYMFYAHMGSVPMPPWGFLSLPDDAPASQVLHSHQKQSQGDLALQHLVEHRQAIGAPGMSAAVAIGGQLVWTGVAGWADVEQGKPVTPTTQFRIGSTSKTLTMTALARQVQQGQIDLEMPIGSYAERLPNPEWEAITPRQLASHMAGLPEYAENRDWLGLHHTMVLQRHYHTAFASLDVFDGMPLLYTPGTRFHYTTYDTVLLSAVMSEIQNEPFHVLMQQTVFEPLGMDHTAAEPISPTGAMATFYWRDGARIRPWRRVDLSHRLAGGGYISTPTDLVKLGSAWLDEAYLSESTRQLFWQPQRVAGGEINPQNYALGWRIHLGDEYMAYNANHGGVSRGSQCWLMVVPSLRMVVAVTMNAKTDVFWDFANIAATLANTFAQPNELANTEVSRGSQR